MSVIRAGLIGDHIGESRLSRALALLAEQHGMTLEFEMIDTGEIHGFEFDAYVDGIQAAGWSGVTITHPWKTHAAHYAGAEMDAEVQGLGAANTLIFQPDLKGYNTDFTGFVEAWRVNMQRLPGRVAMAGAGGVARAIAPALLFLGASEIVVWDQDVKRARTLVDALGPRARTCMIEDSPSAIRSADGLVNATPMGMGYRGGTAFDPDLIGPQSWVFDAVYTPTETPFLKDARAKRLRALTGFDLFSYMALNSFEKYSGHAPDRETAIPLIAQLRPNDKASAHA